MMRIGGFCAIMVRICTGLVCVRRSSARAVGLRVKIERVVLLARGMLGRNVELGEVEVVGLDVGTFGDREAHVGEDLDAFVEHLADRVDAPLRERTEPHRQRHVGALVRQPRRRAPRSPATLLRASSASLTRPLMSLTAWPNALRCFRRHRRRASPSARRRGPSCRARRRAPAPARANRPRAGHRAEKLALQRFEIEVWTCRRHSLAAYLKCHPRACPEDPSCFSRRSERA